MELFSVLFLSSRVSSDKLLELLKNGVQRLHISKVRINWAHLNLEHYEKIVCVPEGTRAQIIGHKHLLCTAASTAAAEYILDDLEEGMLKAIIQKEYGYEEQEEVAKIIYYCKEVMGIDGIEAVHSREKRISLISTELCDYLAKYGEVNLEGFLNFRMKSYTDELREIVDYAIDEYLMEKQYQDFIALLKYFVYIQEAKIPVAHLMHKGENDFVLLNEEMKPIDTKHIGGLVVELMDKDVNYEDMIVSTLISVSPQKVYIHTREPDKQVIKTIQQIFENRTNLCTYCSMCKPILGKKRKNRLYP